jgi:hypothetical protein
MFLRITFIAVVIASLGFAGYQMFIYPQFYFPFCYLTAPVDFYSTPTIGAFNFSNNCFVYGAASIFATTSMLMVIPMSIGCLLSRIPGVSLLVCATWYACFYGLHYYQVWTPVVVGN